MAKELLHNRLIFILIMGYVITGCDENYNITGVDVNGYVIEEVDIEQYEDVGETVPIIVGEEIKIYGDEVAEVPIVNTLEVDYICNIGTQSGNDYTIDAAGGDVGEIFLYIEARNDGEVVRKTRSTLVIKEKVNTGSKTVTQIGDSLMGGGATVEMDTLRSILDAMTWTGIGTTGTAPNEKEYHSGKTYDWLVNHADSPFTKAGVLDIPAYYVDNGLSVPDFIYMRMGVNDAISYLGSGFTTSEQAEWIGWIDELLNGFLNYNANVELIVGLPSISENTGAGWQNNYGPDPGNTLQNEYIRIIHVMWDLIIENYEGDLYSSRVMVAYAPWGLDRDDGYPKVNGVHTNGVHPDQSGYENLGQGYAFALNDLL